jgi:hypothetical protein
VQQSNHLLLGMIRIRLAVEGGRGPKSAALPVQRAFAEEVLLCQMPTTGSRPACDSTDNFTLPC